jgi:hypothetical protein
LKRKSGDNNEDEKNDSRDSSIGCLDNAVDGIGRIKHPAYLDELCPDLTEVEKKTRDYFMDAKANGFEIIFIHVNNNWFKLGVREHQKHKSQNPDPKAFAVLEKIITTVHKLGGRVHIWAWGDESRKWTPIGLPGGINGKADR